MSKLWRCFTVVCWNYINENYIHWHGIKSFNNTNLDYAGGYTLASLCGLISTFYM